MITTGNESSWHLAGEARMLLNILRRGGQPPTINVNSARVQKPWHGTHSTTVRRPGSGCFSHLKTGDETFASQVSRSLEVPRAWSQLALHSGVPTLCQAMAKLVTERTEAEKTSSLPSENPEAGCGETPL